MAQYIQGPLRSFPSSGAVIPQFSRVKLVGGVLALAGAADGPGVELGTVEWPEFSSNLLADLPVRLRTAQGTAKMIASGPIAQGAEVYCDVNGEVGVTNTNPLVGTALNAVSAAGSIVEVLRT